MKVLLANHTLDYYAGSETFTYTLAVELQRKGHDAVCFSRNLGSLADRLRAQGISVTNDLTTLGDDVNIIHSHHRYESFLAYARFPNRPMLLVCHGVLPWQEQPLRSKLNVFRYVAVSEEVKAHLIDNHFIDSKQIVVIRNGVDLTRFRCRRPIETMPKRALVLSNYMPEKQLSPIRRACERLNVKLTLLGGIGNSAWNVEDYINQADLVFSLGRGVLEALACKRVVIVCGHNGADGLVTPETFKLIQERNFSGRAKQLEYGEDELLEEIERYSPSIPEQLFEYVCREHDIRTLGQRYLELYESAIDHCMRHPTSTESFFSYRGLEEVVDDAGELRKELRATKSQLDEHIARLQQRITELERENARLQTFADAVRQTWVYRFYKMLIRPFTSRRQAR